MPSSGPSPFKGVCWHKAANRWMVAITVNGKRSTSGYFECEEDAARMYDEAAVPLGRPLNFPGDGQFEAVKGGGGGTSNYKGVYFLKQQWVAQITIGGKKFGLGYYASEEEAARKYDEFAGPLGRPLNLPESVGFFCAIQGKRKRASLKVSGFLRLFSLACNARSLEDQIEDSETKRPFKGVRRTTRGTWAASISVNKKTVNLGVFNSGEGAARKYDEAAAPLGRSLNFPDPFETRLRLPQKRFSKAPGDICDINVADEPTSPTEGDMLGGDLAVQNFFSFL